MANRTTILAKMAPDYEEEESEYEVEFSPPSSYSPPDEARGGREWEGMATFKLKPDGRMCLVKIGGIPLDEPEAEEEVEVEEEEISSPESLQDAMSQQREMMGM